MPTPGVSLTNPSHSISSWTDCTIENGKFNADSYNLFKSNCKLNDRTSLSLGMGARVSCKQTEDGLDWNTVPMAEGKLKYNVCKIGDKAEVYATERLRVFDNPIPQSKTMFCGDYHPNKDVTLHAECGYTTNFQPGDGRFTASGGIYYKNFGVETYYNKAINSDKQYPLIISIGGSWSF